MSHSPLKMYTEFHKKHCLITGQGPIADIAKNLGFTKVTTIEQLCDAFPNLDMVDHKKRRGFVRLHQSNDPPFTFFLVALAVSRLFPADRSRRSLRRTGQVGNMPPIDHRRSDDQRKSIITHHSSTGVTLTHSRFECRSPMDGRGCPTQVRSSAASIAPHEPF